MQKVIEQITDQLVSLVTSDKSAYTLKVLLKAGIPSFVVERIRLVLEDKVKEEVENSEAQWFNRSSKFVADEFENYLQAAISASHIPSDHLYTIVHAVVKDIIYVFIEPRKKMAEYIFREDEELSLQEVEKRCGRLTIYKHFGTAIPLYMKKRELETLTIERCTFLIQKLDTKLVASYTAQDWAQKLDELFVLFGGKVEPMLLATYFEDKGLYGMSGKFEGLKTRLTKSDFTKIISTDSLEGFEPVTPGTNPKKTDSLSKKNDSEKSLIDSFFGNYDQNPTKENSDSETIVTSFSEGNLSDDEMSELLSDIANEGVIGVDDFEQVDSLNKLFSLRPQQEDESQVSETSEEIAAKIKIQKEDESEEIVEFRENLISILNQAKHSFENIDQKEEEQKDDVDFADVFDDELLDEDDTEVSIFAEDSNQEEENEEKPMWAQFLSEDQMQVMMGGERNKGEKSEDSIDFEETVDEENIFSNDVFIDEQDDFVTSVGVNLEGILDDRKSEFIEIIFNGSEHHFNETIQKIKEFSNWKETSSFIQNEVFSKNEVDLFAGATVDFTDRLHRYFNDERYS